MTGGAKQLETLRKRAGGFGQTHCDIVPTIT